TLRELPQLLAFLAETDRAAHVRRAVPQSEKVGSADAVDRERAWPIEPSLELEMLAEPVSHKKLTKELGPPVAMALLGQEQVVEHSLWVAARALEERASLLALMATDERAAGREDRARSYSERAHKSRHSASA